MSYGYECLELLTENYSESLNLHRDLAEKAIALNESDSRAHYAMACAHFLSRQMELANLEAARAVELNPSEYHNICMSGYMLKAVGRVEESIACFNESLRRNPLAPNSCLRALGEIEYHEKNYAQSAIVLARMSPSYIQRVSSLAAAYGQLRYEDAALAMAQEFRKLAATRPGCPAGDKSEDWRKLYRLIYAYMSEEDFEHMLEGLGKAGLPA